MKTLIKSITITALLTLTGIASADSSEANISPIESYIQRHKVSTCLAQTLRAEEEFLKRGNTYWSNLFDKTLYLHISKIFIQPISHEGNTTDYFHIRIEHMNLVKPYTNEEEFLKMVRIYYHGDKRGIMQGSGSSYLLDDGENCVPKINLGRPF